MGSEYNRRPFHSGPQRTHRITGRPLAARQSRSRRREGAHLPRRGMSHGDLADWQAGLKAVARGQRRLQRRLVWWGGRLVLWTLANFAFTVALLAGAAWVIARGINGAH